MRILMDDGKQVSRNLIQQFLSQNTLKVPNEYSITDQSECTQQHIQPSIYNSFENKRQNIAPNTVYLNKKKQQQMVIQSQQQQSILRHKQRLSNVRKSVKQAQREQTNRAGSGKNWNAKLTIPETPRFHTQTRNNIKTATEKHRLMNNCRSSVHLSGKFARPRSYSAQRVNDSNVQSSNHSSAKSLFRKNQQSSSVSRFQTQNQQSSNNKTSIDVYGTLQHDRGSQDITSSNYRLKEYVRSVHKSRERGTITVQHLQNHSIRRLI